MPKYNIKINEQKVEMEGNSKDEYQIRTRSGNKQEVNFEKREEGIKSKEKIKLDYRKKPDGKEWEEWKPFESEVEWNGGWIANGMKFKNKDLGGVKMKEEFKPSLGFLNTPTYTCWGGISVVLLALVALIWWWIASSNKEDKEERDL